MKINQIALSKSVAGAAIAAVAAFALGGCTGSPAAVAGAGRGTPSAAATTGAGTAGAGASTSSTAGASSSASAPSTASQNTESQSTASAGGVGTPECADGQLKVGVKSAGVAMGHEGYVLVFTNTSSAACVVEGYPGAGVTDTPGQVVLNATRALSGFMSEGTYPAPHPITLAPGAVAATLLEWIDMPLHGETPVGANCPGMDSGNLLITPPNTAKSTAFPAPDVCVGYFLVYPLIPGSSGRLVAKS